MKQYIMGYLEQSDFEVWLRSSLLFSFLMIFACFLSCSPACGKCLSSFMTSGGLRCYQFWFFMELRLRHTSLLAAIQLHRCLFCTRGYLLDPFWYSHSASLTYFCGEFCFPSFNFAGYYIARTSHGTIFSWFPNSLLSADKNRSCPRVQATCTVQCLILTSVWRERLSPARHTHRWSCWVAWSLSVNHWRDLYLSVAALLL